MKKQFYNSPVEAQDMFIEDFEELWGIVEDEVDGRTSDRFENGCITEPNITIAPSQTEIIVNDDFYIYYNAIRCMVTSGTYSIGAYTDGTRYLYVEPSEIILERVVAQERRILDKKHKRTDYEPIFSVENLSNITTKVLLAQLTIAGGLITNINVTDWKILSTLKIELIANTLDDIPNGIDRYAYTWDNTKTEASLPNTFPIGMTMTYGTPAQWGSFAGKYTDLIVVSYFNGPQCYQIVSGSQGELYHKSAFIRASLNNTTWDSWRVIGINETTWKHIHETQIADADKVFKKSSIGAYELSKINTNNLDTPRMNSSILVAKSDSADIWKLSAKYISDGTPADNITQINLAILEANEIQSTTGGPTKVLIAPGIWEVNSTISTEAINCCLSGFNGTVLKLVNNFASNYLFRAVTDSNLCVENLTIDANGSNQTGDKTIFYLLQSDDHTNSLRNINIYNLRGVGFDNCNNLDNCNILSTTATATNYGFDQCYFLNNCSIDVDSGNINTGFITCQDLTNCVIISGSTTGFNTCDNLVNCSCSGATTNESFRTCNDLVNCYAEQSLLSYMYGNCTRLTNCICNNVLAPLYGFRACYDLNNCICNMSGGANGFTLCERLVNCNIRVSTGTGFLQCKDISNCRVIVNNTGIAFNTCYRLTCCRASTGVGGTGFLSCLFISACVSHGFANGSNFNSCSNISSSATGDNNWAVGGNTLVDSDSTSTGYTE